jgi:hypothetical protein
MLINELDCEISLPSSVDDRYIQPHDSFRSLTNSAQSTGLVATIHITRLYAPLYQTLKSSFVPLQVLRNFDEDFRLKQLQLPEAYQAGSNALFDTTALPTVFALLSARFHLYRRNLAPVSGNAERINALDRCIFVAKETAKYVSRALHNPLTQDHELSWQGRVFLVASSTMCLHLWRCILVLCFRGEYDAASVCLHLSSAIGNVRKINVACGRNIAFFLDRLLDRLGDGRGSSQQHEFDEEMIAYVSADAQGSLKHSWVWAGTNLNAFTVTKTSPHSAIQPLGLDETMRDALPVRASSGSPKNGNADWDDWGRIDRMVRQLKDEQLHRATQPPAYYPPPHNPVKRDQLAPEFCSPPKPTATATRASSSTSRISIANLI